MSLLLLLTGSGGAAPAAPGIVGAAPGGTVRGMKATSGRVASLKPSGRLASLKPGGRVGN